MKYQTAGAFRRALEARLNTISRQENVPLIRLRKMVAFERFLARLLQDQPNSWVLKGGYALQLRLGDRARTTKDVDVLFRETQGQIHDALMTAGKIELGDWFTYEIGRPASLLPEVGGGERYAIHSLLDGRTFEKFGLDVGVGDPIVGPVEYLHAPGFLEFAGIEMLEIPSYPVPQQIAEKLHAYTRPRAGRENTRIKDLVDIYLLAELGQFTGHLLEKAIRATFEAADTHPVPDTLPEPPAGWRQGFQRLANEVGLTNVGLEDVYSKIQEKIEPALTGKTRDKVWNASRWRWE